MIATEQVLSALEYLRVLERIAERCATPAGRACLQSLRPTDDTALLLTRHDRARLLGKLGALQGPPPVPEMGPTQTLLNIAGREGTLLTGPDLSEISSTLENLVNLSRYIEKGETSKGSTAPEADAARFWRFQLAIEPALMERLKRTVSPRGDVLSSASPGLAAARSKVGRHREEVRAYYRSFLADEEVRDALQDQVVTERDGRLVVPVKRERQSRVPGLLHALSSSGSTAFVEPQGAVAGNNHLREALLVEEAETLKVLAECTRALLAHRDRLENGFAAAAEVDAFGALARYGTEFGSVELVPVEGAPMRLLGARHPLLALQSGGAFREAVIPLDLSFENGIVAVLVSGPNAGGKTASLKTLGLTCLMAQAGLPVLCGALSSLPSLKRIDSDLSDEQDLEKHLSTYAAKLSALRRMMDSAEPGALILLDELGGGTDPREGGALGLAVLERLTKPGARVFATTHQPELKRLIGERPGFMNAAMVYDEATGRPTFRLVQGLPGRSHALSLAREVGFPPEVLERAKQLLPEGEADLSDLLEKAARDVLAAESARREAEASREKVSRLEVEWMEKCGAAKDEARRIREEARTEASGLVKNARRQVEHLVQGLDGGKGLLDPEKVREARRELNEKIKNLEPAPSRKSGLGARVLKPGDSVVVRESGVKGKVEESDDDRAVAGVRLEGGLKVSCDYEDLDPAPEPVARKSVGFRGTLPDHQAKLEMDVRGCRADEALAIVDKFLDDCLVSGQAFARIIHGKGTGRLRETLHEHLRTHPSGVKFRLGEWGEGDYGVTVLDLK